MDAANVSITGGTDADGFPLQTGIIAVRIRWQHRRRRQRAIEPFGGQLTIAGGAQISSDTIGPGPAAMSPSQRKTQ